MATAKTLPYTWEDLTGLDDIGSEPLDSFRLTFRSILADSWRTKDILKAFFRTYATYLGFNPRSDLSTVLYRLTEQCNESDLASIKAWCSASGFIVSMSFRSFRQVVSECYLAKPMPIILGKVPELRL